MSRTIAGRQRGKEKKRRGVRRHRNKKRAEHRGRAREELLTGQAKAALQEQYQALEDIFRDLLDLTNQLEPGMLVERAWTVERDRLIKEFMILTGLRIPERRDG